MATAREHWSPTYIADRLRFEWWQRRNPAAPWLVAEAVDFLDTYLRPTDVLVEFGSGRNTLWLARRVARLIVFEDLHDWYENVRSQLESAGAANVDYQLITADALLERADAAIASAPGAAADGAIVEGLARDRCALWAAQHVRPGGIILIDKANHYLPSGTRTPKSIGVNDEPATPAWKEFAQMVASWRYVWWTNGVADAALYFKPHAA